MLTKLYKIIIASLLIGIVLFFAIWKNLIIAELILIILFATGIAILSFLITGKIFGKYQAFSLTGGFAMFGLVVFMYFQYSSRLFKITKGERELIEILNPSDKEVWEKEAGHLKYFNAPFAFAANKHFKTKLEWFKNPEFELSILIFDTKDSALHNSIFIPRFNRLRTFLDSLKSNKVDCQKFIEIRVYTGINIPSTSFFITKKSTEAKSYSIMYMTKNAKPEECLVSESKTFELMLENEFQNFWDHESTRNLSIAKLLNPQIDNSFIANFY